MGTHKADVIVIAGTLDARQIISALAEKKHNIAATVTTKYGNELIEPVPNVHVFEKKLTAQGMAKIIQAYETKCLVDASHPYAAEASKNAMIACELTGAKYLRYERTKTSVEPTHVIPVGSYLEAYTKAELFSGNILLTTGSTHLDVFLSGSAEFRNRLFVRILPDSSTIAKCEKAGLPKSNIIAMKGPFSEALNIEIMKHINAQVLITKDSGTIGGTQEKINAALAVNAKLIMIERPQIEYKKKVETIDEVVSWVGVALGTLATASEVVSPKQ